MDIRDGKARSIIRIVEGTPTEGALNTIIGEMETEGYDLADVRQLGLRVIRTCLVFRLRP